MDAADLDEGQLDLINTKLQQVCDIQTALGLLSAHMDENAYEVVRRTVDENVEWIK